MYFSFNSGTTAVLGADNIVYSVFIPRNFRACLPFGLGKKSVQRGEACFPKSYSLFIILLL